ncbi:gll3627 [Gloeobacter violaceus PCC 7421]|uniref:Gll3627 protein n=2 Tax=Gloeobacter violaceus TaxID=33072 RepID=Q7NF99_GLOVI|nr:gll3627 [Gloeobacter violaceus PCC 7421]
MHRNRLSYLSLALAAVLALPASAVVTGPIPEPAQGPALQPDSEVSAAKAALELIGGGAVLNSDFDGNGSSDIVWRNYTTGANTVWLLNGANFVSSVSLPSVSNLGWFIAATGDFNADGSVDILWRNNLVQPGNTQQGLNSVWLMNGTTYVGSVSLPAQLDSNWRIRGAGDFNGDGSPDIVWRNFATGANVLWLMDGVILTSTVSLPAVGLDWVIYGSGDADYDNNGTPDIIWRNTKTGANSIWLMDGPAYSASAILPAVSPNVGWEPNAFGDYSADGKPDIIWRNYTTGANTLWLLDGTTFVGSLALPAVGDRNWEMEGPR